MLKGKVLIAHGDELRRQEIAAQLTERNYSVLTAATGPEALARVFGDRPDIIILDDELPDLGGPEACQEIRRTSVAPLILLSARSDETDVVLGLGMGADYYLTKPARTSAIVAYVEAAARRRNIYSTAPQPDRVQVKDLTLDIPARELRRNGVTIPLSNTEFRLIQALAVNAGRILTRDHLLDCVWDLKSEGVYSRTVDVHIARIRRKMGDSATNQTYIKTVPGFGYKMLTA